MIRYIRDWMLVLFAYVCGKVLRIKYYRPIVTPGSGMDLVRWRFSGTASRLTKLMRLWGYRLPSVEEVKKVMEQEAPPPNYPPLTLAPWTPTEPAPRVITLGWLDQQRHKNRYW